MASSVPVRRVPADHKGMPGFLAAIGVMSRVIHAIMLRESRTRYGSSDIGYTWAVIDPMIQLLVLWGVYMVFGRRVPLAASMPVFLVTGILPYNFWRDAMSRSGSAISSNLQLLTYPQVRPADVVIARTLLEGATAVIVVLVFVIGLNILYGEPFSSWTDEPAELMLAFAALFYFGLSSAFFSSGLARIFPAWNVIFSYLSRPLWFTSGIFFTLESLPQNIRVYASYNPVAHMVEWIRSAALPGFESLHYSRIYVLGFSTVFLVIGLAIDRVLSLIGHADQGH